ncbi:MAG: hypothetical protein AAFX40_12175 [Cyanobacteria bacterium J06639_1]
MVSQIADIPAKKLTPPDLELVNKELETLLSVRGALIAGLGNWKTGQCLANAGRDADDFPNSRIETAIQYNSKVIKAKMRAASALKLDEAIDDMMISLPKQWHIIKFMSAQDYFLYMALDRSEASIATVGFKLMQVKQKLSDLLTKYA